MIFGHLLTSSNFNDEEEKVTGGRNGYGAKLCNVFSNKFTVETGSKKKKQVRIIFSSLLNYFSQVDSSNVVISSPSNGVLTLNHNSSCL